MLSVEPCIYSVPFQDLLLSCIFWTLHRQKPIFSSSAFNIKLGLALLCEQIIMGGTAYSCTYSPVNNSPPLSSRKIHAFLIRVNHWTKSAAKQLTSRYLGANIGCVWYCSLDCALEAHRAGVQLLDITWLSTRPSQAKQFVGPTGKHPSNLWTNKQTLKVWSHQFSPCQRQLASTWYKLILTASTSHLATNHLALSNNCAATSKLFLTNSLPVIYGKVLSIALVSGSESHRLGQDSGRLCDCFTQTWQQYITSQANILYTIAILLRCHRALALCYSQLKYAYFCSNPHCHDTAAFWKLQWYNNRPFTSMLKPVAEPCLS